MKRISVLLVTLLLCIATVSACSTDKAEDTFELAELNNPFIGKWQSEIPSADTTLTFDYKADGTFDYEMAGVPAEQGGIGSGGYIVTGNTMITWLDFEGAAAYTFEVIDNDTINVTEMEPDENGRLVPGNTAPFTRVDGSDINTKNVSFDLSNTFIGAWECRAVEDGQEVSFKMDFKSGGTFTYEMDGVPVDHGGAGSGGYIVYSDKIVAYYSDYAAMETYAFEATDTDTVSLAILEYNDNGELTPGDTAEFVRAK